MVVGYSCTNCGYKYECDVAESGERICPDCGYAVTGITGDVSGNGDRFEVKYRERYDDGEVQRNLTHTVVVPDAASAYARTDEQTTGDITVTEINRVNN